MYFYIKIIAVGLRKEPLQFHFIAYFDQISRRDIVVLY